MLLLYYFIVEKEDYVIMKKREKKSKSLRELTKELRKLGMVESEAKAFILDVLVFWQVGLKK